MADHPRKESLRDLPQLPNKKNSLANIRIPPAPLPAGNRKSQQPREATFRTGISAGGSSDGSPPRAHGKSVATIAGRNMSAASREQRIGSRLYKPSDLATTRRERLRMQHAQDGRAVDRKVTTDFKREMATGESGQTKGIRFAVVLALVGGIVSAFLFLFTDLGVVSTVFSTLTENRDSLFMIALALFGGAFIMLVLMYMMDCSYWSEKMRFARRFLLFVVALMLGGATIASTRDVPAAPLCFFFLVLPFVLFKLRRSKLYRHV